MKPTVLTLILILCILLSGCNLLPQEEQLQIAPVFPEYEREPFQFVTVERGDLQLVQRITCTYLSVQKEALNFPVSGVYYDEFFVKAGDRVEAGQLLAQLDCSDIQDDLDSCQRSLTKLSIRMDAVEEDRTLALQRQKIALQDAPAEELNAALASVNARFDAQRQSLLDEQSILRVEEQQYLSKIDQRKLYANISGIVTYLYQPSAGEHSSSSRRIAMITNTDAFVFRADTSYWALFPDGQEFFITVNGIPYAATAVPGSSLGQPESEKVEGESAYVYFRLNSAAPEMEDGTSGVITVQLDARENVLILPKDAIDTIYGQTVVYYEDENGLKSYKPVETGLEAGSNIEIISGLEEGDRVIIG